VLNRPPDEVWAFLIDMFEALRVAPGLLGAGGPRQSRWGAGRSSRKEG
jgi:hypothetical protein